MNKIYRNILAAASALMALSLTGCVNEDSPCPDNDDPGQGMSIQFTVVTHNPGQGAGAQSQTDAPSAAPALNGASRADDCNGDQTGSPAENFIDMSTCQFFLFDGTGTVLRRIFPEETWQIKRFSGRQAFLIPAHHPPSIPGLPGCQMGPFLPHS